MKKILCFLFIAIFLMNCGNENTLQGYFVDNLEAKNFITQDLPLSMIKLDKTKFTKQQKEAYNSVKKLNILGYKANKTNPEAFKVELAKVKTILHDTIIYKELMEFSDKGNKVHVKYVGTDDEADEVVVLGVAKNEGFAIVRMLGNDMSPDKMVTLLGALEKADIDKSELDNIMEFFKL